MKTLALRVARQNENAGVIAEFLHRHSGISKVYYPGLKDHPGHDIAKRQMTGFGGMVSFELKSTDSSYFSEKAGAYKASNEPGRS